MATVLSPHHLLKTLLSLLVWNTSFILHHYFISFSWYPLKSKLVTHFTDEETEREVKHLEVVLPRFESKPALMALLFLLTEILEDALLGARVFSSVPVPSCYWGSALVCLCLLPSQPLSTGTFSLQLLGSNVFKGRVIRSPCRRPLECSCWMRLLGCGQLAVCRSTVRSTFLLTCSHSQVEVPACVVSVTHRGGMPFILRLSRGWGTLLHCLGVWANVPQSWCEWRLVSSV